MSKKRISILVGAHHRVEDFRPYKISMADRGDAQVNRLHALRLAIKREANWNCWFDGCGDLYGKEKEIEAAINSLTTQKEVIVFGYDEYSDSDTKHVGLVIWCETMDDFWNIGFGMARNNEREVTVNDSDKYSNKWVTLSKSI